VSAKPASGFNAATPLLSCAEAFLQKPTDFGGYANVT
jgi:hypothetical protein